VNTKRIGLVAAIMSAGIGLGVGTASATPPVATPEPGGVIRMDIAPGEWWNCSATSVAPPFLQYAPGYLQFSLGPNPAFFRFAPGADVWVSCLGSGQPFMHYGPFKAGI